MSEKIEYYELRKVNHVRQRGTLVTAAVMSCLTCGKPITNSGGPGMYICIPCGDAIKGHQAIGCIKWEEFK